MQSILLLLFVLNIYEGFGSTAVKNVQLLQHRSYMLKVIDETVKELEEFEWCNLKIPEITEDLDFEFFNNRTTGTITFKNGFVVSVQHADVLESSLNQFWAWDNNQGIVEVKGQLRLHDVLMGFDADARLNDQQRHYTSTFLHRLISFDIVIKKNIDTNLMTATVTGIHPVSTNSMIFNPEDRYTDFISYAYDPNSTRQAVFSWATDIIQPMAENVAKNKVEFPTVCYDCAPN